VRDAGDKEKVSTGRKLMHLKAWDKTKSLHALPSTWLGAWGLPKLALFLVHVHEHLCLLPPHPVYAAGPETKSV